MALSILGSQIDDALFLLVNEILFLKRNQMSSTYFFKGKVSEATKYFFSVDKRCQEVSLAG